MTSGPATSASRLLIAVAICLFLSTAQAQSPQDQTSRKQTSRKAATDKPNILFLLADDLGYGDLACFGRPDIRTPVLDSLAEQGVKFTAHYSNGAECTPTRAALISGRYPQRSPGLECAIGVGEVGRYEEALQLSDAGLLGLRTDHPSLPKLLKEAGYATMLSGKWHLGYAPRFSPIAHGFDRAVECAGGEMDYFHHTEAAGDRVLKVNGDLSRRQGYFTDIATNEAIDFIEANRKQPFFLYVAYTAPHAPFQGPEDYQPQPLPADSPLWKQGNAPPQTYIKMIEHLDRSIGTLLTRLDELGLAENTLVIFASDNGGTGSARNAPYSGHKGMTLEGGIRVPGIARWPGRLPAGTTCDIPCLTFDFSKSMAIAGGVPEQQLRGFDGIDILSAVATDPPQRSDRKLYWRRPRGKTIWKAVRDGDLKYVAREDLGEGEQEFLFNLKTDPTESDNLKERQSAEFQRLKQSYLAWEQEVHDRPTFPAGVQPSADKP